SFVSVGWTTVLWWAFGFSVCFSGDIKSGTDFFGILGNFHWAFLRGITLDTPSLINPSITMIVFCAYQMRFAIITRALITGAFANRVTFKAYMLFLTAWLTLVYFPFVHMVWGGGIMASWGVLDFAGGIVVHNIAVAVRGPAQDCGCRAALDPVGGAGHGAPLVRMVRLQRGQRVPCRFGDRGGVSQHRSRGKFCCHRLALHGLDDDKETEVSRFAHRRRSGPGHDHARRGLCLTGNGLSHRNYLRRGLLLRRSVEEQAEVGRCAGCLGSARRRRLYRHRSLWSLCHHVIQSGGRGRL